MHASSNRKARNNLKVTVGICVRNGANVISEAIESILNQDFSPEKMEILFVDDGSNDETLAVIQSYLPKIASQSRVFHHEWRGLGFSRNVVVNNARGEYIIWVDCDISLAENFIAKQVDFMDTHSKSGVAKGQYGISSENSVVGYLENIEFVVAHLMRRQKANQTPFGTGGSIYRTAAIRQAGGFDENIRGSGEDVDAENKIKLAGWTLDATGAVFYEERRKTWLSLWNEYFWHGSGSSKSNMSSVSSRMMWPPILLVVELSRAITAYQLTSRKIVFLLPVHYAFKRTAWLMGLIGRLFRKPS